MKIRILMTNGSDMNFSPPEKDLKDFLKGFFEKDGILRKFVTLNADNGSVFLFIDKISTISEVKE